MNEPERTHKSIEIAIGRMKMFTITGMGAWVAIITVAVLLPKLSDALLHMLVLWGVDLYASHKVRMYREVIKQLFEKLHKDLK